MTVQGSNATAATALEVAKVELLSSCRLLQPAAPGNTEFVLSLADPLPDTLLTVIQVTASPCFSVAGKTSHRITVFLHTGLHYLRCAIVSLR